jgi:hypothetical protein
VTDVRPACPRCSTPVDRLRRSHAIVAAYPCNHWLTTAQAAVVRDQAKTLRGT